MPYVPIYLSRSHTTVTVDESGQKWGIVFRAKLEWLHSVTVRSGLNLRDLPGTLDIYCRRGEGEPFGRLEFNDAYEGIPHDLLSESYPASYTIGIGLPPEEVRALALRVQDGHPPTSARVEVPDLAYDWAPDGTELKWPEGEEKDHLAVRKISFLYGLTVDDQEQSEEFDRESEAQERAEQAEWDKHKPLAPELQALVNLRSSVEGWAKPIFIALVGIFLLLIFKR